MTNWKQIETWGNYLISIVVTDFEAAGKDEVPLHLLNERHRFAAIMSLLKTGDFPSVEDENYVYGWFAAQAQLGKASKHLYYEEALALVEEGDAEIKSHMGKFLPLMRD